MNNRETQMSDRFRTAALLAIVGGFLETYTFLLHGNVFANAQTGNIALCGMALASGRWFSALKYATPVFAFAIGVFATEQFRVRWKTLKSFHWREFILFVETLLLCGCLFPANDMIANLLVSIVCAMQVQSFRKVRGGSYASTMCTGNLRSGVTACVAWLRDGNPEEIHAAKHWLGVVGFFLFGAASAVLPVTRLGKNSILIPIALLLAVAVLLHIFSPRKTSDCHLR